MGEIFVIDKSKEKTGDKYLWLIHKKYKFFSLIYIKNNRNIFSLCIKAQDIHLLLINVKNTRYIFVIVEKENTK